MLSIYLTPGKVIIVYYSHVACHHYPSHVRMREGVLPFHLFLFYSPLNVTVQEIYKLVNIQ